MPLLFLSATNKGPLGLKRVLKGVGGGGGGSDPISQCYFMQNSHYHLEFFKIPTRISNVVYNNKPTK